MDFTIVTAITPNYEEKLKLTFPTWFIKPQFQNKPILFFTLDYPPQYHNFSYFNKSIKIVPIENINYKTKKDAIYNYLTTQTHKYIETPYWIKIDADVFFQTTEDIFQEEDLQFELVGHRWNYTKPASNIKLLNEWAKEINLNGNPLLEDKDLTKDIVGHTRIASFVCLHRTEFTKRCSEISKGKNPIASHDTFLWYMAERAFQKNWKSKNIKKYGVSVFSNYHSIKNELLRIYPFGSSFLTTKHYSKWNKKYHYGTKDNILNKVQLEVTTDCNLKCMNCDRCCGLAPSKEEMSLQQIDTFVKESLDLKWNWKRIDILGGEPTLYSDLKSLWKIIERYKREYIHCKIRFSTNGIANMEIIKTFPSWINIRNSQKKSPKNWFNNYNNSPKDSGCELIPFCDIPWRCGLGLTRNGYFPCGAGASLARVFKYDIGIPSLTQLTIDGLEKQITKLCEHCGHSPTIVSHRTNREEISKTWKEKIFEYNN